MVDGTPKNPMLDPGAMETWFSRMAEAMRLSGQSQESLRALAEASTSPQAFQQWLLRFMPLSGSPFTSEVYEDWLEEWWKAMGVVPRSRYLEVLDRCEKLQSRLQQAEDTIAQLRTLLANNQEAGKIIETWGSMLQEGLKSQVDWMRLWSSPAPDNSQKEESEDAEPPSE